MLIFIYKPKQNFAIKSGKSNVLPNENFMSMFKENRQSIWPKEHNMCWAIQLEIRSNLTYYQVHIKLLYSNYQDTIQNMHKAKQMNTRKNCYDILKTQINGMNLIFKNNILLKLPKKTMTLTKLK